MSANCNNLAHFDPIYLFSHVMRELIDTERSYVSELQSILEGYASMFNSDRISNLPAPLQGKRDILFGNMDEIYNFHST